MRNASPVLSQEVTSILEKDRDQLSQQSISIRQLGSMGSAAWLQQGPVTQHWPLQEEGKRLGEHKRGWSTRGSAVPGEHHLPG